MIVILKYIYICRNRDCRDSLDFGFSAPLSRGVLLSHITFNSLFIISALVYRILPVVILSNDDNYKYSFHTTTKIHTLNTNN